MASANYIAAAKKENRQPTVLLSIEDAAAETTYYTTQAQWDGSDTLSEIRTAPTADDSLGGVGDAWHAGYGITQVYDTGYYKYTATYDHFPVSATLNINWSDVLFGATETVRVVLQNAMTSPTETYASDSVIVAADSLSGGFYYKSDVFFGFDYDTEILNTETWWLEVQVWTGSSWLQQNVLSAFASGSLFVVKEVTAQIITSAIDLGATPSSPPTINIDDTKQSGASIVYTYTYSSDDISYSSGGTITDGDSLTAARYYKIQADFTSTNRGRGLIRELSITEGLFRYYGTHIDEPFSGIEPVVVQDSVGSLKSSIDLKKGISTTGEISVDLHNNPDVSDLVSTGFLKGKDVQLLSGFVGLDTESYLPVLTGSIQDVTTDPNNGRITLRLRDILKQFEKRKIPEVTYDASGNNTGSDITYTTTSLITVIKDIFDKVGVRARYISSDYDTLEAGAYAANDYKVSRVLPKKQPIEAWKLLDELGQTGGIFMVPLGNGELKPVVYDRNAVGVATVSASELRYGKIDILYKDFLSRFLGYYNFSLTDFQASPDYKSPGKAEDFDNAKYTFNATAETLYFPEKGQKDWFDKWRVGRTTATTALTSPPQAIIDLLDRWDSWYSDPLFKFDAKDMPPRFADIDPGNVITINDLPLPVPAADNDWDSGTTYDKGERVTHEGRVYQAIQGTNLNKEPEANPAYWADIGIRYELIRGQRKGFSDHMRWLVLSKTFDPNRAVIDMTFLQMPYAELGAFSADAFSTAFSTTGN